MITCQAWDERSRNWSQSQGGDHGQGGGHSQGGMRDGMRAAAALPMSPLERALVRLLTAGYLLHDAAPALGLSVGEARLLLDELQGRVGVPNETRLIVLAVLNAWV